MLQCQMPNQFYHVKTKQPIKSKLCDVVSNQFYNISCNKLFIKFWVCSSWISFKSIERHTTYSPSSQKVIEAGLIYVSESLYTLYYINKSNNIIEKHQEYACHAKIHSEAQRSSTNKQVRLISSKLNINKHFYSLLYSPC